MGCKRGLQCKMTKKPVDKFSSPIPLRCPQCSKKFYKSVDWLKRNLTFGCPENCGKSFVFTSDDVLRLHSENVQNIENSIEALRRDRRD